MDARAHTAVPDTAAPGRDAAAAADGARAGSLTRLQRAAGNQAVQSALRGRATVRDAVPGAGQPIAADDRRPIEQALGVDLSHARAHRGPEAAAAARRAGALAYTVGSHVVVGGSGPPPAGEAGRRLLHHELVHVAQQRPSAPVPGSALVRGVTSPHGDLERSADRLVARIAEGAAPGSLAVRPAPVTLARDVPEGMVETPDPDWRYVPDPDRPEQLEEGDLRAVLARDFDFAVSEVDPSVFLVPPEATRADVAHRLLGDETRAGDVRFVHVPAAVLAGAGDRVAAQPRDWGALVPEAREVLHRQMRRALDADVEWTTAKLSERFISRAEEAELTERLLRWSQRSGIPSETGRHYFDRYLDALHGRVLVTQFWGTRKTALNWLLAEARSHQELIRKAIELRSSYTTGYTVTDQRPEFAPGDVIGRFFYSGSWGSDYSIQLRVRETVANEDSLERAETVTRNTASGFMRVVVPGGDGRFYGYTVVTHRRMPTNPYTVDMRPEPERDPEGRFYWYHPGTVYIARREFRLDYTTASEDIEPLRRSLLESALAEATADDLGAVVALDFDVLATATLAERLRLVRLVFDGRGRQTEAGIGLLTRVILSTPGSDFPLLERQMATSGLIGRLLALTRDEPALAGVARAFTLKTLQAVPLGVETFLSMPTLRFGMDDSDVLHYVASGTKRAPSEVVPPEQHRGEAAARLGAEPGSPGEAAGPIDREVVELQPAILRGGMLALIDQFRGAQDIAENNGPLHRLLPTQLVQVEVLGPQPQTLYMTALEAAATLDLTFGQYARQVIVPAVNINLIALSLINLGFAFGPALAGGVASGGLRGGLTALAQHAASQAGRQALRRFAYEATLLSSMMVVDAHRRELEQSEAGRAFLALYDVAMVMLIARDVYAIARSGLFQRLGQLGVAALATVGGAAQRALRRTVEEIKAWSIAVPRAVREGVLVPAAAGPAGALRPRDPAAFGVMLNQARAEVATTSLMTGLEAAGASTTRARRVMDALQRTPELAAAQTAVARRATNLSPAEAERFLGAVETTLANPRGLNAELSGWLQAAARADDGVAYLAQVNLLIARRGVSAEAISVMGSKARAGTADIGFINRSGLTDRDLSFLGRDPRTPWQAYERVAAGTPSFGETLWARGSIRGASAELAAQRDFATLLPDFRISGRQVQMNGKIIDFQITARGLGRRHGFEVKGWTQPTWQEALTAYQARATGRALTDAQRRAVGKIDHMLGQLQAAKAATGNAPYLGLTDKLSRAQRQTLQDLLQANNLADTIPVFMSEARILDIGRRLRGALGLP